MLKRVTVSLGAVAVACLLVAGRADLRAQQGTGQAPGQNGRGAVAAAQGSARSTAPIDLTGYWVSIVTEDWRWRMVTPAKGDYASVPLTAESKKIADAWDPARDEAAGEQCRSYGAPAIMHVPGRLHVTWQDDNTLKIETDAGMQTRLFRFGESAGPVARRVTWQGNSRATWEAPPPARGGGGGPRGGAPAAASAPRFGNLKVSTTNLRPGYLRKNGIPYSGESQLTEYWDLIRQRNGDQWLIITSVVHDPVYLQTDWITSLNFMREQDASKWDPQPCSARW